MYRDRDQYDGWKGLRFDGTGFFRLEDDDRRWWFVTPAGNAFLSFGINHVEPGLLRNPGRQHSGVQDPFGNHYPIVESMRNFSAEMYDIASQ